MSKSGTSYALMRVVVLANHRDEKEIVGVISEA
jgi:hypothetical protein